MERIKVPEGCEYIKIEEQDGKVIILLEGKESREFMSPLTGSMETMPATGDLAILWNGCENEDAIIAVVDSWKVGENVEEFRYVASNGVPYEHAMRFRDKIQYDKVCGRE